MYTTALLSLMLCAVLVCDAKPRRVGNSVDCARLRQKMDSFHCHPSRPSRPCRNFLYELRQCQGEPDNNVDEEEMASVTPTTGLNPTNGWRPLDTTWWPDYEYIATDYTADSLFPTFAPTDETPSGEGKQYYGGCWGFPQICNVFNRLLEIVRQP